MNSARRVFDRPPVMIIGAGRSGTTLLRSMLRQHPALAFPPIESPWIIGLAPRHVDRWRPRPPYVRPLRPFRSLRAPALDDILSIAQVRYWGVAEHMIRATVDELHPAGYGELVAAVFTAFALHEDKARWGDKTPVHARYVRALERLFPGARYVHIVRDGRAVAASMYDLGIVRAPAAAAFPWLRYVNGARRAAPWLGDRYYELRLEDLAADPERSLRRLCEFLEEDYDERMLRYHELDDRLPRTPRHPHVTKPPTPGLRDWRRGLSSREQEELEAACAPLLRELGYPTGTFSRSAPARARLKRLRHLGRRGAEEARIRTRRDWNLQPSQREAARRARQGS